MEPKKIKSSRKPEAELEEQFEAFMRIRGWFVMKMHGSKYQAGFPDYYCTHPDYRVRLVELKMPSRQGEVFTAAQLKIFPLLSAHGSPIWVITAATDYEYDKLFKEENWWIYLQHMRRV